MVFSFYQFHLDFDDVLDLPAAGPSSHKATSPTEQPIRHSFSDYDIGRAEVSSGSQVSTYSKISKDLKLPSGMKPHKKRIYLFARSAREKERWFHW
jgi:hypothetical protein